MRLSAVAGVLLLSFFAFFLSPGCNSKKPEQISCVTPLDCPYDWFCEDGWCVEFPDAVPSDSDIADRDVPSDADQDSDGAVDSDTDNDADTDSDADSDTDADGDTPVDVRPDDDAIAGDGDELLSDIEPSDDDSLLVESDTPPVDDTPLPDDDIPVVDDTPMPDTDLAAPSCGDGKNTIADGLALYLRMDEVGGLTSYDSSVAPANGVFSVGASLGHTGVRGNALAFNQSSNLQVADTAKLDLSGAMSVSAWVYLPYDAANIRPYMIVGKGSGRQANFVLWREVDRTLSFEFHEWELNGIICGANSSAAIDDAVWHHVTGIYDGAGHISLYVDGLLQQPVPDVCTIVPVTNNDPVTIGQVSPNIGYTDPYVTTGYIDEVRIYNRALSADEILFLKDGPHEFCDDGDKDDGDGCSAACVIEPNAVCSGSPSVCAFSATYTYTGATQSLSIPVGVTSVTVEAWGGQGRANGAGNVAGGPGGYAKATIPVTPGDTLYINVGQGGGSGTSGGWNGGGTGGTGGAATASGGGGGGASDVRRNGTALTDRVIVAGGGGGAGGNRVDGLSAGAGGGGGGGYYGGGGAGGWAPSIMAGGGTQSTGGVGGSGGAGGGAGTAGTLGTGGIGENIASSSQSENNTAAAGAAGGGAAGANGTSTGNWTGGSGGGGSGYVDAAGNTDTSMSSGIRSGDGMVIITY